MQPLPQFTDKDRYCVAAKTYFHKELALYVWSARVAFQGTKNYWNQTRHE